MIRLSPYPLALLLALVAGSARAEPVLTAESVDGAGFEEASLEDESEGPSALALKVQVLLDRAGISPGVIDGYFGENVEKAIAAFERREGLPEDGVLDADVFAALAETGSDDVLVTYALTEEDLDGPFVESIPEDYGALAEMERLGYRDVREMLAERFHMDRDLLHALNPDADFTRAGAEILVAAPGEAIASAEIDRLEVSRSGGSLSAFDAGGRLVAFYPATIGSEETPSPSGTHEVVSVALDPVYYYRPDVNFRQGDNDSALEIAAGPNNPVGSVWIDLSEPTYGIHGTPEPALIDKSYSHGCVRLTNWDAEELAGLVGEGLTVAFVE